MRAAIISVVALLAATVASAVEVDGIAAKVGSETILRSDVINELRRGGATDAEDYTKALNWLIDRKLILKAAAESKMSMQEWVVDNRIREIVNKAFGGDRNRLIETLAKDKVSFPEWRAKTKEDLIVSAMRWNVIDKNVTASPAAMRKEYAEHPEKYVRGHKVTVTVIMLKPDEVGRRDEISDELKTKSFEALGGRQYADVNPSEIFKPEIAEEIAKMPKGTISHWIEIDGWSFLLRKDGETAGKKLDFAEALDAVEAAVKESEAERLYKEWIDQLRAETYIKVF